MKKGLLALVAGLLVVGVVLARERQGPTRGDGTMMEGCPMMGGGMMGRKTPNDQWRAPRGSAES